MSRRLVLTAGLSWLLLAGVVYLLVSLLSGGADAPPDAAPARVDQPAGPVAPAEADDTPPPQSTVSPAAASVDPVTAKQAAHRLSFCSIEGVVLLAGKGAAARVEARLLRPGGVGYVANEFPPLEISFVPQVFSISTRGFDDDEIPALTRVRDPFAPPHAAVRAGTDGRFRFGRLAPGIWEVTAIGTGRRATAVTASVRPEKPRDFVELGLPSGPHTFAGRIRFADGRPFRGAIRLIECRPGYADVHRPSVPAGADGGFCFEHVGDEPVSLLAWTPGALEFRTRDVLLPRRELLEVVLDAASKQLEGRVVDAATSEPVAGARVVAGFTGGAVEAGEIGVFTDTDGGFSVAGSDESSLVTVYADGYPACDHDMEKRGRTVRLQHFAAIEGRVTNQAGMPLVGIDVAAAGYSDYEEFGTVQRAVTDALGRYRLESLPPGSYTVYVWHPDWVSPGLREVSAGRFNPLEVSVRAGETATNDLAVVPTVEMKGRVIDQCGRPVPAARILVGKFEPHGAFRRYDEPLVTTADERGRFTARVPSGPCQIHVAAPGSYGRPFSPHAAYGEAGRDPDGTVVCRVPRRSRPERTVTVEVVNDAGHPVPDARVTWCGAADRGLHVAARTGADGRCRLTPVSVDADGDLLGKLAVVAPGHLDRESYGTSRGSGDSVLIRVTLIRARRIDGRVSWPDGGPAAGAWVYVEPISPSSLVAKTWQWWPRARRHAAVDGRFRFLAPAGPCRITASDRRSDRRYEAQAALTGGDEVKLVLAPCPVSAPEPGRATAPEAILVRLLGPCGQPIDEAEALEYVGDQDCPESCLSVVDGECELDRRSSTVHRWLVIIRPGDRDGRKFGALVEPIAPDAAGEIRIQLADESVIEGVVVDADGIPARGCLVTARHVRTSPPAWYPQDHATARTDAEGRFRLGGLGSYTYSVEVTAWPPAHPPGEPVKVTAPATGVRVSLARGREVKLRFLLEDGRPVHGLVVRIADGASTGYPEIEGVTDANGLVTIPGLHPGRPHELYTGNEAWGLEGLSCISESKWMPRDAVFRMKVSYSIAGVVRQGDGRPAAGAVVWHALDGDRGFVRADAEGRFMVPGGSSSTTRLRTAPRNSSREDWGLAADSEIEVRAGARQVELILPPYRMVTVRTSPPPAAGDELEYTLHTRRADGTWAARRLVGRDDGSARIALRRDDPRRYLLRVEKSGLRTTMVFEGELDPKLDTVTARLVPAVVLRIRVTLGTASWAGLCAWVKVRRGPLTFDAWEVKDRPGEYRAENLVPGPCRVVVIMRTERGFRLKTGDGATTGFASVETEAAAGAVVTVPVTIHE